jgi:hypothetical protein
VLQLFISVLPNDTVKTQTQKIFRKDTSLQLTDSDIQALIQAWQDAVNQIVQAVSQPNPRGQDLQGAGFEKAAVLIGIHVLIEALYDELILHSKRTDSLMSMPTQVEYATGNVWCRPSNTQVPTKSSSVRTALYCIPPLNSTK